MSIRLISVVVAIALSGSGCESDEQKKQVLLQQAADRRAQIAQQNRVQLEKLKLDCSSTGAIFLVAKFEFERNEPLLAESEIAKCDEVRSSDPPTTKLKAAISTAADKRRVTDANQRMASERVERKKKGVSVGMSVQEVLQSSWGRPETVNRTTSARGTREQWVYPGFQFLYFEDGVLTTIQNRER